MKRRILKPFCFLSLLEMSWICPGHVAKCYETQWPESNAWIFLFFLWVRHVSGILHHISAMMYYPFLLHSKKSTYEILWRIFQFLCKNLHLQIHQKDSFPHENNPEVSGNNMLYKLQPCIEEGKARGDYI